MSVAHTDTVLLIGHGSQDAESIAEYHAFARALAGALGLAVQPCFLEFAEPAVAEGLRLCVRSGARRVVALPLFLGPAGHQKNDVPAALNWARERWPDVQFRYGTPLGAQYPIVEALAGRAAQALAAAPGPLPEADTALVVVGRGSRDPDSNSEVARLARLLWEGRGYGWVEPAYFSLTGPGVEQTIARCARLGARRVVVLPYLLFTGTICRRIGEQAAAARAAHPGLEVLVGAHLGDHPGVIAATVQRYAEAAAGTAAMTCDLCKYRQRMAGFEHEHGLPQGSDHRHGLRGAHAAPATLELLPPRYRDGPPASATPMGAAPLLYDGEGQVAWDQIWTGFCDLALAGGPPHRGALLEPVAPEQAAADPAGYERALAELERGLRLVTGLGTARGAPGWVGLACDSEEMALWLLRAIVVENISVRREGATLFLPAGPQFRLEHEIKSVITAVAKTHHYWQEHLLGAGAPGGHTRER